MKFEGDGLMNEIKRDMKGGNFKPLTLIIFGDSKGKEDGMNKKVLKEIINQINKLDQKPDYVITLGDMVAGSDNIDEYRAQLMAFKAMISQCIPIKKVFPVLGNHEVDNEPSREFESIFENTFYEFNPNEILEGYKKTVYYVDIGNLRLIFLNSYHFEEDRRITGSQLQWLKKISDKPDKIKILFVHTPPYPTGAHKGTCMDYYREERDRFWKVIDENNINLVFSGHEHNYSRRLIDNSLGTEKYQFSNKIYQIITGGGGEKLKDKFKDKTGVIIPPKPVNHFVKINIDINCIEVQAISTSGKIIDKFTLKSVL